MPPPPQDNFRKYESDKSLISSFSNFLLRGLLQKGISYHKATFTISKMASLLHRIHIVIDMYAMMAAFEMASKSAAHFR